MKTLRSKEAFCNEDTRILVIESVSSHHFRLPFGMQSMQALHFSCQIEAVAVVTIDQNGTNAYNLSGRPVSVGDLLKTVPGLNAEVFNCF